MKHLGDITAIDWSKVEPVDVVTGGSPCQDLSVAGKRAGLAGERSGLFMEQIRCVKELRKADEQRGDFEESGAERQGVAVDAETGSCAANPAEHGGVSSRVLDDQQCVVTVLGYDMYNQQSTGEISRTLKTPIGGDDLPVVCAKTFDARGNGDGDIASTLTGDHNGRVSDYTSIVVGARATYWDGSQLCETLTSNNADGSQRMPDKDNFNCVIALDRAFFNQGQNALYDPQYYIDGTVPTLVARAPSAVAVRCIVRRLTPLECERLMGYPDGWTDIGEWTDSKGKKHKEADSPRYKALGNSIALPFWKWLLKRISAQYERDATLGSLFDGIGGFPLCWEQINGKGTARWASEIEEFPIAVTKIRFPEVE